ncbi:MAG: hypothetical protein JO141_28795, partial [Bradyrhizobium sp.]|nr:hypothetical protein [Bradyrhizobium sp.]
MAALSMRRAACYRPLNSGTRFFVERGDAFAAVFSADELVIGVDLEEHRRAQIHALAEDHGALGLGDRERGVAGDLARSGEHLGH